MFLSMTLRTKQGRYYRLLALRTEQGCYERDSSVKSSLHCVREKPRLARSGTDRKTGALREARGALRAALPSSESDSGATQVPTGAPSQKGYKKIWHKDPGN